MSDAGPKVDVMQPDVMRSDHNVEALAAAEERRSRPYGKYVGQRLQFPSGRIYRVDGHASLVSRVPKAERRRLRREWQTERRRAIRAAKRAGR